MTIILKQLFSFLKLLNSDTGTNELAMGMACGLILGFSPFLSLQTLVLILLIFMFRIQIGAALFSSFLFKFVAFLLDPVTDTLGRWVLEARPMRPVFVTLYNLPIVPFTRFNNSIVMGSAVLGIVLLIPSFLLFRFLIEKYREKVVAKFQGTKFWKLLKATALFKWYATYEKMAG